MLITILHKNKSGETSIVDVRFLPAVASSSSYVVTTGFDIRAACARKHERILVARSYFEFQVFQRHRVNIQRWTDSDTMPWLAVDNKNSAEQWINKGKAIFGVDVVGVYVDSTEYEVTLYVPQNATVESKTDEAYIML